MFPDVRVEVEDRDGTVRTVDLELVTKAYHRGHLAAMPEPALDVRRRIWGPARRAHPRIRAVSGGCCDDGSTAGCRHPQNVIAQLRHRVLLCAVSWFWLAPIVAIHRASGSGVKVARDGSPRGAQSARNLDAADRDTYPLPLSLSTRCVRMPRACNPTSGASHRQGSLPVQRCRAGTARADAIDMGCCHRARRRQGCPR